MMIPSESVSSFCRPSRAERSCSRASRRQTHPSMHLYGVSLHRLVLWQIDDLTWSHMVSHDLTSSHDQTARRDMVQNPNKDARKLRLFQLPFPRINEGISISYTATHNKLPAAKQIKAAAPAPSKLAARKVPSPMPNGVIKERRINNVHQALTDTVSSSKDPAEKAANSLCAMIAINISENSDISSAAPVAVPSMRECRHRPRTADIPAVQDFPGRTTRGRSSASDSLSESESSSITWGSRDSWPWPCPLPGKKTSTERMVRKPIPSRAYPNGNASADLSPLKKTAMATPCCSIWSLASASIWTKVTARRIPPARALETRTIFGEKLAANFDKAAPLNATMNKTPADTAFTVVSLVMMEHCTIQALILLNQNLHRHMQFYDILRIQSQRIVPHDLTKPKVGTSCFTKHQGRRRKQHEKDPQPGKVTAHRNLSYHRNPNIPNIPRIKEIQRMDAPNCQVRLVNVDSNQGHLAAEIWADQQ